MEDYMVIPYDNEFNLPATDYVLDIWCKEMEWELHDRARDDLARRWAKRKYRDTKLPREPRHLHEDD
jgi:hypothetical protein